MEAEVSGEDFDRVLTRLEGCLKQIDASQGSMVKLRKAEFDLLGQYEIARDMVNKIIRTGNRALLKDIAGVDCARVGRLRAALAGTRLSDMNASDQRFTTCNNTCSSFEELVRKDLGASQQLDKASMACKKELLSRRASELMNPARVANSDDEGDDGDKDDAQPGLVNDAPATERRESTAASAANADVIAEALKLFQQIDSDGDGKVSKTELKRSVQRSAAIKKALKIRSMSECSKLFTEADLDSNGSLDLNEFTAFVERMVSITTPPPSKQVWEVTEDWARLAFASADQDSDGHLTLQELRLAYAGVLLSAGEKVSRKRVARWASRNLKKYDVDGNQTLEFPEFFELLKHSGVTALVQ